MVPLYFSSKLDCSLMLSFRSITRDRRDVLLLHFEDSTSGLPPDGRDDQPQLPRAGAVGALVLQEVQGRQKQTGTAGRSRWAQRPSRVGGPTVVQSGCQ